LVLADRFDHEINVVRAGRYHGWRGDFWPPAHSYSVIPLDLGPAAQDVVAELGPHLLTGLADLRDAVEDQWVAVRGGEDPGRTRFPRPAPAAEAMRRIAALMPPGPDRTALEIRARALLEGYSDEDLQALVGIEEDVVVVAGRIATWIGKENTGLPTAFAAVRESEQQQQVTAALATLDAVRAYVRDLHPDLELSPVPAFVACRLFFMAGEGERHPKHIAYFLPEDEGIKRSPFKKTYYFGNTHRVLLETVGRTLAERHLAVGHLFDPTEPSSRHIPTLGVLGHEIGHGVRRPGTRFKPLNAADRWASVVLQEVLADVFGALVLADVWVRELGVDQDDAIAYYLAECLRYADRGSGSFPDSDGMLLQLSYLVEVGALDLTVDDGVRLAGEPGAVVAGLRSLARVLADAVLTGTAEPAVALWRTFGPRNGALAPLVDALRPGALPTVDYLQEALSAATPTR
jgi:hypothetical protein